MLSAVFAKCGATFLFVLEICCEHSIGQCSNHCSVQGEKNSSCVASSLQSYRFRNVERHIVVEIIVPGFEMQNGARQNGGLGACSQ